MAQTKNGALKIAAARIGITPENYLGMRIRGFKWCMRCKKWQLIAEFGNDSSRSDGLDASCRVSRNKRSRELHVPVPPELRQPNGPPMMPFRDGDKKQARKTVNLLVRTGRMARPADLPCFDCGHVGHGKRHEYDHFKGYSAENHLTVQAVCSACHCKREMERGSWGRQRSNGPREKTAKRV